MEQNRDADINIASEHFSGDLSQCNMVFTKVEEASYENNFIISFKKTTKKANCKLLDHIKGLNKIWIKYLSYTLEINKYSRKTYIPNSY